MNNVGGYTCIPSESQEVYFKATFTWDRICSDPFVIGSTLVRGSTLFTRDQFQAGTVWFHIG